jgi:LysM repeat protein
MNTGRIIGAVVVAHVVVIGAIMLPGCGRTVKPAAVAPVSPPAPTPPVVPGVEQPPKLTPPVVVAPPAPVKAEPVLPPPEVRVHVVSKGDSLSKIAKKYGVRAADLVSVNGIKNPNLLREGQELKIPLAGGAAPSPAIAPVVKAPASVENVYVVAKGDVLSRIAVRHGTTTKAIKELNGLKSDTIVVGQKLRVPGGKAPAPAVPAAPAAPAAISKPVPSAAKTSPAPTTAAAAPKAAAPPPKPVVASTGVAAPVADAARPAADAAPLLVHEVRADEDLVGIAMMYGVSVEAVKKANGLAGDTVKPGQKLKIP